MKYILLALVFLSCNSLSSRKPSENFAVEVVDTLQSAPTSIEAKPLIFETAFIKGTTQQVKKSTVSFYGVNIGRLKIKSGHIIACDPLHIDEYGIPFTQVFPVGEFPVHLSVLKLDNQESVAFARVNFSDEPVQRWEFALQQGQAPLPVGGKEKHGYSVDGGVGIFMDAQASKALTEDQLSSMEGNLNKAMEKHYHDGWRYTFFDFGSDNLACFSSGLGDGYYASYIGFDAKGNPCRLLTDFGLFDWKSN